MVYALGDIKINILPFQLFSFSLVFVAVTSIILFNKNMIVILLLIETIFLASSLNCVLGGFFIGDIRGQIFAFILLTISAAELAIALSAVVIYYRIFDK
jgi:NADH-quinone oxidoreductase subunit K